MLYGLCVRDSGICISDVGRAVLDGSHHERTHGITETGVMEF